MRAERSRPRIQVAEGLTPVCEKDDAVAAYRAAIGATDPAEAAEGTVRKLYAESKGKNAIHASDSDENAARKTSGLFESVN